MPSKRACTIAGTVGFGLCKTAVSVAYMTAMGSVFSTVGFVSELDFMIPMLVSSILTSAAIVTLVAFRKLSTGSLSQAPAVLALLLGFLLSATGVLSSLPGTVLGALHGVLCGFALTVLNAVWLELFIAEADSRCAVGQIVGGLAIQCVLSSLLPLLGPLGSSLLSIAAISLSALLLGWLKKRVSFPANDDLLPRSRTDKLMLAQSYLCLFVLVGVVGILHTAVLGSQSEHLVGDVSMWMPLVAATIITALVAGLTIRRPDPTAVYKGSLPAMLVILSLLPFLGHALGGLAGLVMITCYDVCGMVFLLFIVDRARALDVSGYALSSVYFGGSSLFLIIGLGLGGLLRTLSADHGLSLLTLLAFAAIYPLAAALIMVLKKPRASSAVQQAESAQQQPADCDEKEVPSAQTVDDMLATGVDDIAERFGLTKREREILGYLARGRSAKYISDTLVISDNTTWAHIKRIYAKTGVHSKQELMSLVEHQS
uniref:LuxR family transcriptional regulator n=1 Tax=Muribaculaceae bacterium Z82 TaxID=2304548 RepID=A0A7C9JR41_9BACT